MSAGLSALKAFRFGERVRQAQDAGDKEAEKQARKEWKAYQESFTRGRPSQAVYDAFNRGYHLP